MEAALTFPFFACFLLLFIFFIRLACVSITLDHAVSETAKQLAAASYPLSVLNDFEDEQIGEGMEYSIPTFSEEVESIKGYVATGAQDVLLEVLTGNIDKEGLSAALNMVAAGVQDDYKRGIAGFLIGKYGGSYYEIRTRLKYTAAEYLLRKFCESSQVDAGRLKLLFVELPRSHTEYELRETDEIYRNLCNDVGCMPGRNDVAIAVEYRVRVPLPFFNNKEFIMRHVAVERAWMNGSNGVYSLDNAAGSEADVPGNGGDSGSGDSSGEDGGRELVYITRTGTRYHKNGCDYLSKSKIPIKLAAAQSKGYIPCRVCVTKTAKPIGHK